MQQVFGVGHTYSVNFAEETDQHGHTTEVKRGMGILEAAAEDIEDGHLARIEDLIASDVFTNFLEQPEHLIEAGYKDPAAMLAGAVLEDGLRRILVKAGHAVKPRDDLTALNGLWGEGALQPIHPEEGRRLDRCSQ